MVVNSVLHRLDSVIIERRRNPLPATVERAKLNPENEHNYPDSAWVVLVGVQEIGGSTEPVSMAIVLSNEDRIKLIHALISFPIVTEATDYMLRIRTDLESEAAQ